MLNRRELRRIAVALGVLAALGQAQASNAQDIVVTLLGTGSPTPAMDRFGPSILVQANSQTLLFDVGRGAHQRLNQLGLDASQIDAIFLTHLHSDHIVGIPDLWLTGWLITRRDRPWNVFGPAGTLSMMDHLAQAFAVDRRVRVEELGSFQPPGGGRADTRDVEPGTVYERDGVRVTAILVDHGVIAPAFGYRIDYAGRSVVLSGDTTVSPSLVKGATGASLLVHEVFQTSADALRANPRLALIKAVHVDGAQAGAIFEQIKPKLAVYSHIALGGVDVGEVVKPTRTTYRGLLVVGEDLMQFVVGDAVTVLRR